MPGPGGSGPGGHEQRSSLETAGACLVGGGAWSQGVMVMGVPYGGPPPGRLLHAGLLECILIWKNEVTLRSYS